RKSETPCMGGVLLIGAIVLSTLLWAAPGMIVWVLAGTTTLLALTGFLDDFIKVARQDRDGLAPKWKLVLQFAIASAALWLLARSPELDVLLRDFYVPFAKAPVWHSWWCYPFSVLVVVGATNAVNLTDGKDGLASGCTLFCALTYAVFAYVMGHKVFAGYLSIPYISGIEEAVVFAAAVCGGCIGFLWHNCHPASMFMGDTGSLALGGAVGMLAVLTRQELLLLMVGGVFVLEIVSVMLQVLSLRLIGRRMFICTPIHHHFERKGWTETQIVVRFWIIAGVLALAALATLKLR
ncbi:MAG: phospho-N-acetylmuramoyl-pentapeptide-transferase, partial [Lentisphaeria bacterium]|nr:phospho-N-acetylmuramoyl-pentapeptide-transferase [Lentisphaeria bacterium]